MTYCGPRLLTYPLTLFSHSLLASRAQAVRSRNLCTEHRTQNLHMGVRFGILAFSICQVRTRNLRKRGPIAIQAPRRISGDMIDLFQCIRAVGFYSFRPPIWKQMAERKLSVAKLSRPRFALNAVRIRVKQRLCSAGIQVCVACLRL
jgi:hypothetical protein